MTQIALPGTPVPKRPSLYDDVVLDEAARLLLPAVLAWLGRHVDDDAEPAIFRQVTSVLRYGGGSYQMARRLEDEGWSVDGELVDIFESSALYDAYVVAVRSWVTIHGIKPDRKIGDVVQFRHQDDEFRPCQKRGEIVGIYTDEAQYTVFCADDRHVWTGIGTHGHVIPYEDIVAVVIEHRL